MEYTVPVYHALPFFTDKILAVPFVQKCWDVGKFCVGKVGTFVTDFRNVEGNVSILIERKYTCTQYLKVILKILIEKFATYLILSILQTCILISMFTLFESIYNACSKHIYLFLGGHEVQMEWLKNQAKEVFVTVNNKIASHPKVGKWQ